MEYKVTEDDDGNIKWYYGKVLHKENGPAVERHDGTKEWWVNGDLHREDGPAIEFADGTGKWFLDGKNMSEEDFNAAIEAKNAPPEEEKKVERFEYTAEEVKSWLSDFGSVVISNKSGKIRWSESDASVPLWSVIQEIDDDVNGLHVFVNELEPGELKTANSSESKSSNSKTFLLTFLIWAVILIAIGFFIVNHLPH